MGFRLSTGLRNAMMGTSTIKEILNGGTIEIYTGYQPASADYAETSGSTKLAIISTTCGTAMADGLQFGTASSGVLPKSADEWQGRVIVDGVAGWFRFYGSDGTASSPFGCHGTSGTAIRLDGAIGVSGADLNLSHTSLAQDSTLTIKTFNITQPAE
jgi:hypothetical protein